MICLKKTNSFSFSFFFFFYFYFFFFFFFYQYRISMLLHLCIVSVLIFSPPVLFFHYFRGRNEPLGRPPNPKKNCWNMQNTRETCRNCHTNAWKVRHVLCLCCVMFCHVMPWLCSCWRWYYLHMCLLQTYVLTWTHRETHSLTYSLILIYRRRSNFLNLLSLVSHYQS